MPAFKFRLAPVLRYREWIEEEKKWQLYTLAEARDLLAATVERLIGLAAEFRTEIDQQAGRFLTVFDLRLQGDFLEHVERRIKEQRELLADADRMLREKREEVIAADKQVKVLERLKERLRERHRYEEGKAEQKVLDEVAQRRHFGKET
jgi:flagellar export protein FliJ